MRVGIDTGGTFTDVVADDGAVTKVLSTPAEPHEAVASGIGAIAGDTVPALLAHGTTVATNALLEHRGARVALVTNEGFADVIEIARQDRPSLYDHWADRPPALVPRERRVEVAGRLDAAGAEVEAVDVDTVPTLAPDVESVAVCLLHADLEPAHERAVASALRDRGHDVTCSHEVAPEFREYERTVTTVVNAYLRPRCRDYLPALDALAARVLVMTSAGGLVPAREAADLPAALLLSGPAGGVLAAVAIAGACGFDTAVSFDMGGTSTDVCLIRGGLPEPAPGRTVGGYPVRLPALDVHTIGAGGGSIARIDPGGALAVGPESAGVDPGPACYGRGGLQPTVTDADLALGRIPPGSSFGGLRLDRARALRALSGSDLDAAGIVAVVDAAMEGAVRHVTVERGVDPRAAALVAFGGAGPLHACALADALGLAAVVVPARAGVLSAVGLLCAPVARELVRSWRDPGSRDGLAAALAALAVEAAGLVGDGALVDTAVDCRYAGQSHELTVPGVDAFSAEHARRNGFAIEGAAIEVVALRARARLAAPLSVTDLPVPAHRRDSSVRIGPAVIDEPDCTIWVPEGWSARSGPAGALVVERNGQ